MKYEGSVTFFFMIFLGSRTDRTAEPIWTVDGSKRVVCRKKVPFGGLVDTTSLLGGGKFPKNPLNLGRE